MDGQWQAVTTTQRRSRHRAPWWWFLAATVLASLGLALAYGSLTPQGFGADESAHTAYANELRHGQLPDIDTIQSTSPYAEHNTDGSSSTGETDGNDGASSNDGTDGPGGSPTPSGPPRSQDYIYVANHPPGFAAIQAAITAGLEGTGLATDATLAVGRALNALFTVGAVVVLAMLGRETAGKLRIGVLAAALFAAVPALWSLATFGYSDGAAILAATVVVWAGVVAWKDGTTRSMGLLGLAVAFAGATRATALVVAAAVVVVVAIRQFLHHRARETNPRRWAARVRRDFTLIALPPLILSAWWYIRTWIRFGDPTGSEILNGRLHRQARPGGILAQLVNIDMWQAMVTRLTASAYTQNPLTPQVRLAPWAAWVTGLLALVALIGLLRRPGGRGARLRGSPEAGAGAGAGAGTGAGAELQGWPILVAAVFGVMFGASGHVSGGGAPHERYLLLAMPVLCLVVVVGLDRLHGCLPLLAVAAAATASLWMLHAATSWVDDLRAELGIDRFGASWLGTAGAAMAVAGIVLATTAAVAARRRPDPARGS